MNFGYKIKKITCMLLIAILVISTSAVICLADDEVPTTDVLMEISPVENGQMELTFKNIGDGWADGYWGTVLFTMPEEYEVDVSSYTEDSENYYYIDDYANADDIFFGDIANGLQYVCIDYTYHSFSQGITIKINNVFTEGTITTVSADDALSEELGILSMSATMADNYDGHFYNFIPSSIDVKLSSVPSYTASYANTPADSVKAGETFTSDVVVTSDSDLSSAQLTLGNPGTAAKIVSIENKLTGDNVSFESSENEDGSWLLSFYGNETSAKDGLTVATVTYEAVDAGSASLSMTAGSAGISGDTADYDITLPEASDVTVILPPISTVDYGGNYSLIKYEPASGENFTYDGNAMYVKDGVFYSVVAEGTEADRSLAAAAEGTALAYDSVEKGDINNSGVINIIDAQIAYDISNNVYSGFDKLTSDQIVKADVNNSLAVDASDARAIQVYVHTGAFEAN